MFCAKEPAGPGIPSPYEVWFNIMMAENPNFNKSQYALASNELNKLTLISLPAGSGEIIRVPLISVFEVFPAAQDLYQKYGDVDKLQKVLQSIDVSWATLLTSKKMHVKPASCKGMKF